MAIESVLQGVLLALQLCLGFWQIGKLTPAGAIIQCVIMWLLQFLGKSKPYAHLRGFKGRVYKTVRCRVTTAAYQPIVPRTDRDERSEIKSSYLGHEFRLERRNRNTLFLNGKMSYYITDVIWHSLLDMGLEAPKTVFLKGYKEFWQQVATGGVMTLSEVLDSLILENHTIQTLDNDLLLPVDLSVSEEKLLKALNMIGLFLQTKNVHWLIPTLLSFTAAVLEFSTSLRVWLYSKFNLLVCRAAQILGDRLPRTMRRQLYAFGSWVENLKPCNDIELRVLRGNIVAVIGGGAKTATEGATMVTGDECAPLDLPGRPCDYPIVGCPNLRIGCEFKDEQSKVHVWANTVALADVDCNRDELPRLHTFLYCLAQHASGSLKSCGSNRRVRVRPFRESVLCYAKSGFPPVYELPLENVIVK